MRIIRSLYTFLLLALISYSAMAQVSIGYLDLNEVLAQYPEMNQANEELSVLENKLGVNIQDFQNYFNERLQEYQAKQQAGISEADQNRYEEELEKLNKELQDRVNVAQEDLMRKRAEVMSPALLGVEKALRDLASINDLDCVVQQSNAGGIPVVLFAPIETNLTAQVLRHMGWPLSADQQIIPAFDIRSNKMSIGFTNVELVLANMPAVKSMEQTLGALQKKLTRDFETKQATQAKRYQEYVNKKETGQASPEELSQLERTLIQQDNELKQYPPYADAQLQERRAALMAPALISLQTAIDKIAADNGFTFILNQTASSGVSTIVHGPENADITAQLFKALNIPGGAPSIALVAAQNIKVGYINVEKVFAGMPDVKEVNAPLQEKFQKAIDAIAAEKGYTYVLNQTSASNILYMNPDHDETKNVLERLKN